MILQLFVLNVIHSEMGMLEQFFAHHFKREVTLFGLMDIWLMNESVAMDFTFSSI